MVVSGILNKLSYPNYVQIIANHEFDINKLST